MLVPGEYIIDELNAYKKLVNQYEIECEKLIKINIEQDNRIKQLEEQIKQLEGNSQQNRQ